MSLMVGAGREATAGVLMKNAAALEVLRQVDTLVVDKTGTLTEGKPLLAAVVALPGQEERALVRLVASLERASEHPLAAAIIAGADERGTPLIEVQDFHSVTGKGVIGTVDGHLVALGNRALLEEMHVEAGTLATRVEQLRQAGQTVMWVAVDGRPAGLLGVTA
jgi:Cu+-exporting ATPase